MRMRRSHRLAVVGAAVALVATAAVIPALTATTAAQAATTGGVKIAYFDQWSVYQNAYYLKNVDTSGVAGKLDYMLYDFENIDPVNLTCFEATKATDPDPAGENDPNAGDGAEDQYADYQMAVAAGNSVDGVGDTNNQPLQGNFNQLKKLKAKYPNLKVLLSLGGWTYSKYFSDVAKTAASRQKFVSSCITMFLDGNIPAAGGFGGPGTAAGIFDGFDIDWEYPGSSGGHLGNHVDPTNDPANFTALLAEFRSELNAYGTAHGGKHYSLTAALPSGQDKVKFIQTNQIGQYLDYGNIMTYDMHGAFDGNATTNLQDPLYTSPNDPMTAVAPGTGKYSTDEAIRAWTQGASAYGIPGGFPANKATVGFPFYYRGWSGVTAGGNHGLYQPATGPSQGMTLSGNVPGVAMYKEVTSIVANSADTFFDPLTRSAWFYDGNTFYGGDSVQSIQAKADYIHCNGLAGAMMFSLYDLDPAATLFNAVVNDVNGTASTCTNPSGSPIPPPPSNTVSPTASPTRTTSPTTSPSASPTTPAGCTAPAWNATTAYVGGTSVSYNGHTYTSKWWTQGEQPDTHSGQFDVWTDKGPCSGGTTPPASPSPTRTTTSPSPSRTTTSPTPTSTGAYPAWVPNHAYAIGDRVSYNGHNYQCLQAHTSLVGWEPPNVPALWQALS